MNYIQDIIDEFNNEFYPVKLQWVNMHYNMGNMKSANWQPEKPVDKKYSVLGLPIGPTGISTHNFRIGDQAASLALILADILDISEDEAFTLTDEYKRISIDFRDDSMMYYVFPNLSYEFLTNL